MPYPLLFLKKQTNKPVFILLIPLKIHCVISPLLWIREPTQHQVYSLSTYLVPSQVSPCEAGIIDPIYRWESRGWAEHIPAKVPVSRTRRWDLNPQGQKWKGDPPLYHSLPKLPILNDSPFNGVCKGE